MIKIIDSTLKNLEEYDLNKEDINDYFDYIKRIGIKDIEISSKIYKLTDKIPEDLNVYLALSPFESEKNFKNIYKYVLAKENEGLNVVSEFQINDLKEVFSLRTKSELDYIRIKGLDDLIIHDYENVFFEIKKNLPRSRLNLCPENNYYFATAIAVMWLLTGGKEVTTSFNGCGNLAATEEVCIAMRVIERVKPNQNLDAFIELKEWYERITKIKIRSNKAIIGDDIFCVESGIHVDGILKKSSNYEAYSPNIIGKKTRIVIGKHSGKTSIRIKCKEYKIYQEDYIDEILKQVKIIATKKRDSLTDEEFLEIVKKVLKGER